MTGGCTLLLFVRPNPRKIVIAAAGIVVCFGAFYFSPAGQRLRARVFWIGDEPLGGARLLIWRDTASMVRQHPLAGVGPENFVSEFPRSQSVALSRAFPDFYHESPHNMMMDALAGSGIPGVSLLFGLCALGILAGVPHRRSEHRVTAGILTAALIGAITAHQFTVFTIPLACCLFTAVALLVVLGSEAPVPSSRSYSLTVTAVLASAAMIFAAFRIGLPDTRLAMAKRALNQRQLTSAARLYELVANGEMRTGGADLYFSRRWATAAAESPGALPKMLCARMANMAAVRATHDPEQRANALYNYAAFAAVRNDVTSTERSLRTAIAVSPNWFKPHWTLARLLSNTGRIDEARIEAARALELDGGRDPEIRATAYQIEARAALSRKPVPALR